jgi:hypothetical protein
MSAAVNLTLTDESKPEVVREQLAKEGIHVPETASVR